MSEVVVTGMDRLAAQELAELFKEEGLEGNISLRMPQAKTGHAQDMGSVAALISDPNSAMLLLLTAWIASKRRFELVISRNDPKTNKDVRFSLKYEQDGATSVLKALKGFFKGDASTGDTDV
jgi:hypothetical protein